MTNDDNTTARERAHRVVREVPRWVIVLTLIVALVTGAGVAQITETWQDDFEDGNADGWTGENLQIVSESVTNTNNSLRQNDGYGEIEDRAVWTDGPVLDLTQEFTVEGTVKSDQGQDDNKRVAIGIIDEQDEGAMIVFSAEFNETFVAADANADPPSDALSGDFDEQWVHFKVHSPEDEAVLEAKVWPESESEPTDWQMTQNFTTETGPFSIRAGPVETTGRYVQLDRVTISGSESTDPSLSLETRQLFRPGDTHEYEVRETRLENGNNHTYDVTANATVESLNTSVLTVDQSNHTLTANENATAQVVSVRAQYNNSTTYTNVTVAEPTVENLQIVPGIWRIVAVGSDDTLFALLVATLLAVPAARFTSAFGGLAVGQLVMTIGWLAGYVAFGIAAVSLFVSLFIGLNLAANTDYVAGGVRR